MPVINEILLKVLDVYSPQDVGKGIARVDFKYMDTDVLPGDIARIRGKRQTYAKLLELSGGEVVRLDAITKKCWCR
jgi:hypothetical protein